MQKFHSNNKRIDYLRNHESNKYARDFREKILLSFPEILNKIITLNEALYTFAPSIYDSDGENMIGVGKYIQRLVKYSKAENSTLVYWLSLIDEFCSKNIIHLNKTNVHMILISSLHITIKVHEDVTYRHKDYAFIGGINANKLTKLENYFLEVLDFKVHIGPEKFSKYFQSISQLEG